MSCNAIKHLRSAKVPSYGTLHKGVSLLQLIANMELS